MFGTESAIDQFKFHWQLRSALSACALALTFVASVGPALARTPYDGSWSVLILTRRGACEPSLRYGVDIIDGKVTNSAAGVATVEGRVTSSGALKVSVQAGGASAHGSGRLRGNQGGGLWRGEGMSGACQGTWMATRRGFAPRAQTDALIFNYSQR